nr:DUF4010 domain-containing protein [Comamonas sp. 26]
MNRQEISPQTEFKTDRVFKLSSALLIAVIIACILLLSAWLQHIFGSTVVLVVP